MTFHVTPRSVLVWCLGVSWLLASLSLLSDIALLAGHKHQWGIRRLVQMDMELNIPALWSVLQLAGATVLLWLTGGQARYAGSCEHGYWRVLAAIFAILTLDEYMSLHERTAILAQMLVPASSSLQGFAWTLVYSVLVPVVALPFLRFWWRLPSPTRSLSMLSAICFIGGALGMEVVGAYAMFRWGGITPQYLGAAFLEETLEMTGVALLIYTCADLLSRRAQAGLNCPAR